MNFWAWGIASAYFPPFSSAWYFLNASISSADCAQAAGDCVIPVSNTAAISAALMTLLAFLLSR